MVTIIHCFNYFFLNFRRGFFGVLKAHKLRIFTTEEVQSLAEYERVMGPLAAKLDILQGDRESYLGSLLPHIIHLKLQLTHLRDGKRGKPLEYTTALVDMLLRKLFASDRFGPMLDNIDFQMATCFHPAYKLNWIKLWDPAKLGGIRDHMIKLVAKEMRVQGPEKPKSRPVTAERRRMTEPATASTSTSMHVMPVGDANDIEAELADSYCNLTNLFNSIGDDAAQEEEPQRSFIERAREFVELWEKTPATGKLQDGASFLDSSVMIELFRAHNTGVVSSAACERFFSQGKDTLRAKRENMSPSIFETLMFMRGNGHMWAVPKCRKNRERSRRLPHPVLEYWANEKC
jgi:hypothetical protein